MGIRNLEKYLVEYHSQECRKVPIKDLVSKYRLDTGAADAVLLVDTISFMRQCLSGLDMICGGQFREHKASILNIATRLTDLGLSPIFFLDGHVEKDSMRTRWERNIQRNKRVQEIFDRVEKGDSNILMKNRHAVLPLGVYECIILTLKEAGYPVHFSIEDCDLEMARYARERDCFAILSQDTDFIILEGVRYFLTSSNELFDSESMTTTHFDRNSVAEAIGLEDPKHLPLLASLLQNNHMDGRYLMPLYIHVCGEDINTCGEGRLHLLVPPLVRYINAELSKTEKPVEAILHKTFDDDNCQAVWRLKKEKHKMFQNVEINVWRKRLRRQLEMSLKMYEYVPPSGQPLQGSLRAPPKALAVLEVAKSRHRSVTFLNPSVLSLLTERILQMGPALEDPCLPASNTSETALRPFRQRVYGLLQVPGPFKEWVVPATRPADGFCLPLDVKAITPDPLKYSHPGLLALWGCHGDMDERKLSADRWRLWGWALAADRGDSAVDTLVGELRQLPEHLVVPVSILYLLFHSGALSGLARPAMELVRLLARGCLLAPLMTIEQLKALRIVRYDRLGVHVATLFMTAFTYVSLLNDVLGAPVRIAKLHPELFFNGKVAHLIFKGEALLQNESPDSAIEERIVHMVSSSGGSRAGVRWGRQSSTFCPPSGVKCDFFPTF